MLSVGEKAWIFWLCATIMGGGGGGDWTHRITQRYSVLGREEGPQDKQPSGRSVGKLKVAVYGERALADSGNGAETG